MFFLIIIYDNSVYFVVKIFYLQFNTPETIKLNTDHYFIEQYNRQRAPQKKISRCLLASWNLDQNLGETYEYALKWKIHDTLSRLGSSENTFTQVYVYSTSTHTTAWRTLSMHAIKTPYAPG